MNWVRLLEIIDMARKRIGRGEGGYSWACFCPVCCELRRLA